MADTLRGRIIRSQSGFFTVATAEGEITAHLRGRLKQGAKTGDLIAVGDWVELALNTGDTPMIDRVEERQSKFSRMAPSARGVYEQIIVANPDQAVFVFACADPTPKTRMLDRFLIIAEEQGLPPLVVANKTDLVAFGEAEKLFGHYPELGYKLIYTSAKAGRGVDELRRALAGKLSVFAGPSGVGKSTLLNAVQPGLGLAVSAVSEATGKGKHTTTVRELFALEGGGYVADTPGLKALALWDIEPEELDAYFPEMVPLVPQCQWSNCTHIEETGCAVLAAVEDGRIHPARYDSYVKLRAGEGD
ncbi:MAG: ribosome small subunit-dependent GTPase A [Anaerolineae bacterium]|nr:MAG: ribosome small subunit-dependent GTPase A [Anaerolineae bacterium]